MSKFTCKSILVIDCKTVHIFVLLKYPRVNKSSGTMLKMERVRLGRDGNFSLAATHAHMACETTNLFTDFEKKTNCSAVYIGRDVR